MYLLEDLRKDLVELSSQGAMVFDIGYTVLGRAIPCVFKGDLSGGQTFIQAGIHAREWVTTPLVMQLMKNYNGSGGIWCVPMANIDGALLAQQGLSSVDDAWFKDFLLEVNGGNQDFSLWKANARAVDLNVNFFARWGEGAQNITYPASGNYIGPFPRSEPETIALTDITMQILPMVTLSYHARGEVVFKGFGCVDNYVGCAKRLADSAGYALENSFDSAGGYKDWFVATTNKLGLTVEVGNSNIPYDQLYNYMPTLLSQNQGMLDIASECARAIYNGKLS